MATYYDGLNDFHKLIAAKRPTSSAQLLGLHLLHLNNLSGNSGSVKVADRELVVRTRLSKQTITEAKRYLKNIGWLDFTIDKDKVTTYTLTLFSDKVGREVGREVGQQLGQPRLVSYTQLRDKEEETRIDDGRMCEGEVAEATKPQVSDTRTLPLSSPSQDANTIHDEWLKAFPDTPLRGNDALKLEELAKEDYARTQAAIAKTRAANPRNPFAYFKTVFNGERSAPNPAVKASPAKTPKYTDTTENVNLFGMDEGED